MAQLHVRAGREVSALSGHELELLTAPALERLLARGVHTAIVPFGSIENQGGHLPLGADAVLADLVGREVAGRLDAVLAPTVRVGCAEQHLELPGTLSVRADTLTRTAVATGASLAKQGFRLIVFVSTHGGNVGALDTAVERLGSAVTGTRACAPRGDVGRDPGSHSGKWLTSVMLALRPDLVDLDQAAPELRAELQDADAERGAGYFERYVGSIVDNVIRLI